MEKQLLKKLNPENAAKELTRVAETVTCLECCKFYIVPETAACGHTLCHGCWIGRQTCAVCALPLKRRALKQNAVIKRYTECVQKASTLFEKQFNIKLEEFAPDPPPQVLNKIVDKDPSKTVNAWLCDSQNHFSAPVSTQLSTQGEELAVEVKTCEIQVHTESKKVLSPTKVVHAPPPPQDDWDKIESVSDTEEFLKNKENFGPNIDPFNLDDEEEYTTDHPRRSFRKREHKNELKPSETSGDKHSSSNISIDTTDKLNKIKQNWSNVKKMRKEFSKLHKKNKNKLNVSIEMCKKTKSAISNPAPVEPPLEPESQKVIIIDDCTPKIDEKEKSPVPVTDKITVDTDNKNCTEDLNNKSPENASTKDRQNSPAMETNQNNDISKRDHRTNSSSILHNFQSFNENQSEPIETEVNVLSKSNIPFLKKSALQTDTPAEDSNSNLKSTEIVKENTVQTVNHAVSDNIETDSDDIQITIKIGSTLTNIFIKKKKNDVKVKLNTDQEAQTLQCMEKATSCNSSPSVPKTLDVQNIEINIGGEAVVSAVTQQTKCVEPSVDQPPTTTSVSNTNHNQTASIKKDTASAETVPVEISASLEKELTKIMECDDDDKNEAQKDKTQELQKKSEEVHRISSTYTPNKEQKSEEMELDEDMFASGSVKENNVQLLKATKPAPSEILMPTLRQKKHTQTQRQADKRNRENDDEMTTNKKIKVASEIYEDSIDDIHNEDNKDESSINYDSVMGQVFANIDADIGKSNKSQSIIENQDKTLVEKQAESQAIIQHSQFLKTQKTQRKVLGLSRLGNATQNIKSNLPPKDSESLFALSNVDSQILTEKGHNQKHGPETQAHIENLLTPGMCQNLTDTRQSQVAGHKSQDEGHKSQDNCHRSQEEQSGQHVIPATPQDHDSDASVCEETPQKASPFARKSNAASGVQAKAQSQLNSNEAQLIKEIINISDKSDTDKDNTVVTKPKLTIATPTINQFCNSIQHNSTPVARKSLNFDTSERTKSSTSMKEFTKPRSPSAKYCVAASCLTSTEVKTVELLCAKRGWTFVKEFTKDLTHLVVGVDEEGRSQRTVKFMCALAAGRWIVRYEWADTWLRRGHAAEEPFEALDWTGEPGPQRARTTTRKLFDGFTFFCMPPFSVLSEPVLKPSSL
ncbi:breast cancer type 1 susceptibility protein homolog isoform X2 [Leguminivora glycinivorella]|uniref:breast cancer type 1 susceptibility protein homolog isoform X2 n=1 Tax=Leguminivora glycinivorella TaxID=1035111 RepID=UPI00200E4565|nr:breast cancer type 1 susceptibility protein homolog isoform X2 [Leguminivora glycinivorella]